MPLLYFGSDGARAVSESTVLNSRYSFNAATQAGTSDSVQFVLVTYSVNGTLLDVSTLRNELFLCGFTAADAMPNFFRFASSTSHTVSCDMQLLVRQQQEAAVGVTHQTKMYELYIKDGPSSVSAASSSTGLPADLFPVAVQLTGSTSTTSSLVNRFFLLDTFSGRADASLDAVPDVVQYAAKLRLSIRAQDGAADRLHPPILSIEYKSVRMTDVILAGFMATSTLEVGQLSFARGVY